jgi:hypothetical protein
MKTGGTIALIIALCIVAAVVAALGMNAKGAATLPEDPTQEGRVMAIEDYVRLNISELSPVKEVLGGTFYVTDVEAEDGKGEVSYEDGHNAYTADFTYSQAKDGRARVETFKVRK